MLVETILSITACGPPCSSPSRPQPLLGPRASGTRCPLPPPRRGLYRPLPCCQPCAENSPFPLAVDDHMQQFLFPLIRAAKLAFGGVGAHLRNPGKLLSPKLTPGKVPDLGYWCKNGPTYTDRRHTRTTSQAV